MVRHIVLWKLKPEYAPLAEQYAAELQAQFRALPGKVDGLTEIAVGTNYKPGEFDLCLVADFTSREAEAAYQTHPEHLKIKETVGRITCGRAAFDYEQ